MSALAVHHIGEGSPVLLIHGGLESAMETWPEQSPLADRWLLLLVDRVGYGRSAHLGRREDFERDAELLGPAVAPGTHVVGHSSGGLAALLLAAERDDLGSLSLIEPPAFQVAADDEEVAELIRRSDELFDREDQEIVSWLRDFFTLFGAEAPPAPVLRALAEPAEVWRGFVRRPWHGDLPLAEVAARPYPKLVFSGGHSSEYETVCDALAAAIGAEREVVAGAGHEVQRTGVALNRRLEALWTSAEREPSAAA